MDGEKVGGAPYVSFSNHYPQHSIEFHITISSKEKRTNCRYGELKVVLEPDECPKKYIVLPKRWIVERTFSWLDKCRRLTSDFEFFANSLQAMVQVAFIRLMLNRFIVRNQNSFLIVILV